MTPKPETPLYHVGCGKALFTLEQTRRGTMAIACGACGAGSPIVVADLNNPDVLEDPVCLPSSLARAMLRRRFEPPGPHVELYLGFSNFQCPAKAGWDEVLRRSLGLTSMSECDEAGCLETIARRAERQRKVGAWR
jgi:hypothetical protein